ncbi:MAG: recombination protein O N-terminal domain-containing protein [Patescibacteria group bacterium]
MHHIYTTPAFVVHSAPYGEAGKFLLLFTKDFGMVGAIASGVRKAESKLRFHVQDYSFSKLSLVRGKEVWRLTGAYEIGNQEKSDSMKVRILSLLKRLLHGEEKNEKLFAIMEGLYAREFKKEDYELIECITVMRILNALGYIQSSPMIETFLVRDDLEPDIIRAMAVAKSSAVRVINDGLKASQL